MLDRLIGGCVGLVCWYVMRRWISGCLCRLVDVSGDWFSLCLFLVNMATRLVPLEDTKPEFGKDTFVAPNASLIGNCKIGNDATVFYGAVLKADINKIHIGNNSTVGDNAVISALYDDVKIGNNALVGMV